MLFLAKSGASQVPPLYSNLSDTVWGCLLPIEAVAFEQGVTLNTNIEPGLIIKGDGNQLKQLITILLDNACKYAGEKGSVTVTLVREQKKVCLKVNNTGTPIPPVIYLIFLNASTVQKNPVLGSWAATVWDCPLPKAL